MVAAAEEDSKDESQCITENMYSHEVATLLTIPHVAVPKVGATCLRHYTHIAVPKPQKVV